MVCRYVLCFHHGSMPVSYSTSGQKSGQKETQKKYTESLVSVVTVLGWYLLYTGCCSIIRFNQSRAQSNIPSAHSNCRTTLGGAYYSSPSPEVEFFLLEWCYHPLWQSTNISPGNLHGLLNLSRASHTLKT